LKRPFSTAVKIGASQVRPIYPTRTLAGPPVLSSEVFLQPAKSSAPNAVVAISLVTTIFVRRLEWAGFRRKYAVGSAPHLDPYRCSKVIHRRRGESFAALPAA